MNIVEQILCKRNSLNKSTNYYAYARFQRANKVLVLGFSNIDTDDDFHGEGFQKYYFPKLETKTAM